MKLLSSDHCDMWVSTGAHEHACGGVFEGLNVLNVLFVYRESSFPLFSLEPCPFSAGYVHDEYLNSQH